MTFVLAVVGSRTFNDKALLTDVLDSMKTPITMIVSGGAKGADTLGAQWAKTNKIDCHEYIPNWKKYGKSAGFRRNSSIINAADAVVAFWDGESRGTANSIKLAEDRGIPVHIVHFERKV